MIDNFYKAQIQGLKAVVESMNSDISLYRKGTYQRKGEYLVGDELSPKKLIVDGGDVKIIEDILFDETHYCFTEAKRHHETGLLLVERLKILDEEWEEEMRGALLNYIFKGEEIPKKFIFFANAALIGSMVDHYWFQKSLKK